MIEKKSVKDGNEESRHNVYVAGEVVGVFSLLNWYRVFGIDLLGTPRFKDMAILSYSSMLMVVQKQGTILPHPDLAPKHGRRCQISTNIAHVHIVVGLKIVRICVGITFQIIIGVHMYILLIGYGVVQTDVFSYLYKSTVIYLTF